VALRLGEQRHEDVIVVAACPAPAEAMSRDALAAGPHRALRVDPPTYAPSETVAAGLAEVFAGSSFVLTGNWSLDRGSASGPAFLAAHLGAARALGPDTLPPDGDAIVGERRVDGSRRERVQFHAPAVLSVEGGSAHTRRAALTSVLRARSAWLEVHSPVGPLSVAGTGTVRRRPFRPRPRVLLSPAMGMSTRERVLVLTSALVERTPPQLLVLDPDSAADRIVEQLRAWGYLE
jgi:electron transfer flavoprotein beta subunit